MLPMTSCCEAIQGRAKSLNWFVAYEREGSLAVLFVNCPDLEIGLSVASLMGPL